MKEVINAKTNYFNIQKLYGMIENLTKKIGKRCIDEANILESVTKEYLKVDIGVTAQEAMDNMTDALKEKENDYDSQWKDLDIDNLPEFIKNDVDVQKLIDGNWVTRIKSLKSSITYDIAEPTISSKYRYRIQEKKPILDKQAARILVHNNSYRVNNITNENTWNGRPIIIID